MKRIIPFALSLLLLTACGEDDHDIYTSVPTASPPATTPFVYSITTTTKVEFGPAPLEGFTELYTDLFLPYLKELKHMSFNSAKEFSDAYTIVKSIDGSTKHLYFESDDGDTVKINIYDDNEGKYSFRIITYTHDGYSIEVKLLTDANEIKYSVSDDSREIKDEKVSSLEECELFMFGESSGTRISNTPKQEEKIISYTVPNGEVLDVNFYENQIIIKTKIKPSNNNEATIHQNYFNIEDLIKHQGCDKYDVIQYWAVADMTDGSESKVIAFDVPSSAISGIKNGTIAANQLGDYVNNLYILPSLKD